jgi:hypothetical protein
MYICLPIKHVVFVRQQLKIYFIHKGKAIPLQAWTGPEGSRRLRLPDFKTIGT